MLRATVRWFRRVRGRLRSDRYLRRYNWAGGNYRWIFPFLEQAGVGPENPGQVVIEVGSRDCLDAVDLYRRYRPGHVYAFEPSRPGLRRCLDILADHPAEAEMITLVGVALGETAGMQPFYEFILREEASGYVNIGASSLYPWNSRSLCDGDPHKGIEARIPVQRAYQVPVFCADDLPMLAGLTVLLMVVDVEGAELAVLRGGSGLLARTRYLCVEAGYHLPRDGGAADARALAGYLQDRGWRLLACSLDGRPVLPEDPGHLLQFDLLFLNTG